MTTNKNRRRAHRSRSSGQRSQQVLNPEPKQRCNIWLHGASPELDSVKPALTLDPINQGVHLIEVIYEIGGGYAGQGLATTASSTKERATPSSRCSSEGMAAQHTIDTAKLRKDSSTLRRRRSQATESWASPSTRYSRRHRNFVIDRALPTSSELLVPSGLPKRFQVAGCRRRRTVTKDTPCHPPTSESATNVPKDNANRCSERVQFIYRGKSHKDFLESQPEFCCRVFAYWCGYCDSLVGTVGRCCSPRAIEQAFTSANGYLARIFQEIFRQQRI